MFRLVLCGSPRSNGRCAALANTLFEGCIAEFPKDEISLVPLSSIEVKGCCGCDKCNSGNAGVVDDANNASNASNADNAGATGTAGTQGNNIEPKDRCVIGDNMAYVYEYLDKADEVILVSPIYFSGAPSQLKALLDRLQPYYKQSAHVREEEAAQGKSFKTATKPATLHVVGEGKSPYGYDALVNEVSSSLAVAGFRLDVIVDWVGKITAQGDIIGEAQMYALQPEGEIEDADNANDSAQQ